MRVTVLLQPSFAAHLIVAFYAIIKDKQLYQRGRDNMKDIYVGFDLGGTKCAVVLGDAEGNVLRRDVLATKETPQPFAILQKMVEKTQELLTPYLIEGKALAAIGVSCGGPLDSVRGIIQSPPNLPLWDNIHICEYLTEHFGVPAFLQNDANACALAEWRFGAGQGVRNMVFLTFGTGLGSGLILDGRLYSGTNGMAGEAGHLRLAEEGPEGYGKEGSFEGFCSGGGIQRLAGQMLRKKRAQGEELTLAGSDSEIDALTTKEICEAAYAGDKNALEIIEISAEYLGRGVSLLVDLLNPELVVIGSVFARSESLFRPTMEEWLKKESLRQAYDVCKVVPAKLGDAIGDIAALTIAVEGMKNQ